MQDFETRTYYQDGNVDIYLEHAEGRVYLHASIKKPSKEALQLIKGKWGEVILKMYRAGYDEAYTYTKDPRLVKMIGGAEKIGEVDSYEVYKWDLT